MKKVILYVLLISILSLNLTKPAKPMFPIQLQQQSIITPTEINETLISVITLYLTSLSIKYSANVVSYIINKYIEAIISLYGATSIPIKLLLSPFLNKEKLNSNQTSIKLENSQTNIEIKLNAKLKAKKTFLGHIKNFFISISKATLSTLTIILIINELSYVLGLTNESVIPLILNIASNMSLNNPSIFSSMLNNIKNCGQDFLNFLLFSLGNFNNIILKPFTAICRFNKTECNSTQTFFTNIYTYIKNKYSNVRKSTFKNFQEFYTWKNQIEKDLEKTIYKTYYYYLILSLL